MNRHILFRVTFWQVWLYINVRSRQWKWRGMHDPRVWFLVATDELQKPFLCQTRNVKIGPGRLSLCGWPCQDQHHHKSTVSRKQPFFIRNHICKRKTFICYHGSNMITIINDCKWILSLLTEEQMTKRIWTKTNTEIGLLQKSDKFQRVTSCPKTQKHNFYYSFFHLKDFICNTIPIFKIMFRKLGILLIGNKINILY